MKAGVLEESGEIIHPATGTPQGGIISPVLANVFQHKADAERFMEELSERLKKFNLRLPDLAGNYFGTL